MKVHPIKLAYDKLPASIKHTAEYYIEGRNILITCLARSSNRTKIETIKWLEDNNIKVKNLKEYKIDDSD